ncbi:MAG: hypothetical protein Kow006_19350 [Gammaproteobacteria bacterium]
MVSLVLTVTSPHRADREQISYMLSSAGKQKAASTNPVNGVAGRSICQKAAAHIPDAPGVRL